MASPRLHGYDVVVVMLLFVGCCINILNNIAAVDAAGPFACFGSNCSSKKGSQQLQHSPTSPNGNGSTNDVELSNDGLPEMSEKDLYYNYDVNGLTILEKIKLVNVLHKHLHGNPLDLLQAKSSLIGAIEAEMDVAPPQYSVVQRKFIGFILNPDELLESTWQLPPYEPIPEFAGMNMDREPLEMKKELAIWRTKNKAIHDGNVEANNQAMLAYQKMLSERNAFRNALNLASFYKLGACVAQKLVWIFDQNSRMAHLKGEYAKLGQYFEAVYEQIEKGHLNDARGHEAQQKLRCPDVSNIDDVDARLMGIVEKNQWTKASGIEDQDFVAALSLVLGLNTPADGGKTSGNASPGNNAALTKTQLEQGMATGEFSQANKLLLAVKAKAQDFHKRFVQQQKANASTRDKMHNELVEQMQLRKTAVPLHAVKGAKAAAVPKPNKEGGDGPLFDTRYQALENLSAEMHFNQKTTTGDNNGKASREQNLVDGIVPILLNAQDVVTVVTATGKKSAADDALYTSTIRPTTMRNGESVESRVPTEEEAKSALKKYTEFMQLVTVFGLAKCVSKQVETRKAMRKYHQLAEAYGQMQETVIAQFAAYVQRTGNKLLPQTVGAIEEDVRTVMQLVCLPQAEEDKGRLVSMYIGGGQ